MCPQERRAIHTVYTSHTLCIVLYCIVLHSMALRWGAAATVWIPPRYYSFVVVAVLVVVALL